MYCGALATARENREDRGIEYDGWEDPALQEEAEGYVVGNMTECDCPVTAEPVFVAPAKVVPVRMYQVTMWSKTGEAMQPTPDVNGRGHVELETAHEVLEMVRNRKTAYCYKEHENRYVRKAIGSFTCWMPEGGAPERFKAGEPV